MRKTTYQVPEIRDENDNIIQEGTFGKKSAFVTADNHGVLDYLFNNLEALHDIMTGAYLISSTSISEFIGAMERMHITEKIVIPMSVIFRFFPTISEEYQAIRDAMKMRGIRFGGKNPFLMLEYRLVPLMVSVVKIGDELSAAALTRGLGAPVKRTNVCQIGFHVQDLIAILFCVICFALFLFQQQISF